jgi:hypothetical protein
MATEHALRKGSPMPTLAALTSDREIEFPVVRASDAVAV